MKKHYIRILVLAVGFAGLSAGAKAQVGEQVAVTLPHDFVVGGKAFPAGRYIVSRISEHASTGIILSSYEKHATVLVLPTAVDTKIVSTPGFRMDRVDGKYYLTKLETPEYVYTFAVPGAATEQLAMKSRGAGAISGTSGSK